MEILAILQGIEDAKGLMDYDEIHAQVRCTDDRIDEIASEVCDLDEIIKTLPSKTDKQKEIKERILKQLKEIRDRIDSTRESNTQVHDAVPSADGKDEALTTLQKNIMADDIIAGGMVYTQFKI